MRARSIQFAGLFLIVAVIAMIDRPNLAPPTPAAPASLGDASPASGALDLEMRARRAVRSRLREPSSADFTKMIVKGGVVCGYVNSRNGFGGMTGPQPFVSRPGMVTAFEDDVKDGGFSALWNRLCL